MRKWHRWLAVVFGVFLFWIALTGFGIQLLELNEGDHDAPGGEHADPADAPANDGGNKFALIPPAQAHGDEEHAPAPANPQAEGTPFGFACPEGWTCRPPLSQEDKAADEAKEFVMHLHSGEVFGPLGVWISIASSLALLFFAASGLWMYVKMFRARLRGGAKRALFW